MCKNRTESPRKKRTRRRYKTKSVRKRLERYSQTVQCGKQRTRRWPNRPSKQRLKPKMTLPKERTQTVQTITWLQEATQLSSWISWSKTSTLCLLYSRIIRSKLIIYSSRRPNSHTSRERKRWKGRSSSTTCTTWPNSRYSSTRTVLKLTRHGSNEHRNFLRSVANSSKRCITTFPKKNALQCTKKNGRKRKKRRRRWRSLRVK